MTEIRLTQDAIDFYKDDMNVPEDKGVRIKGKVYGSTNAHENYSVGIEITEPKRPVALTEEDGLTVFVEQGDEWFVEGLDLEIDYDEEDGIPTYFFISNDGRDLDATSGATKS